MAAHVKMEVPSDLKEKQLELLDHVKKKGKLRVGVNECTKAIEREQAKLVLIAEDVSPPEIVMHLPLLCREKKIPVSYVSTRKELGEKAGLSVGSAAIAITEEGDSKKELEAIVKRLHELNKQ